MNKVIKDVVGALIEKDGRFLVARRKPDDTFGGLWEFPGGCVEHGEEKEKALEREIKEELGIEVKAGKLVYECDDEIPTLKILIYLYECKILSGLPRPIDCDAVAWATPDELKRMELAPADIKIKDWLLERR